MSECWDIAYPLLREISPTLFFCVSSVRRKEFFIHSFISLRGLKTFLMPLSLLCSFWLVQFLPFRRCLGFSNFERPSERPLLLPISRAVMRCRIQMAYARYADVRLYEFGSAGALGSSIFQHNIDAQVFRPGSPLRLMNRNILRSSWR